MENKTPLKWPVQLTEGNCFRSVCGQDLFKYEKGLIHMWIDRRYFTYFSNHAFVFKYGDLYRITNAEFFELLAVGQ